MTRASLREYAAVPRSVADIKARIGRYCTSLSTGRISPLTERITGGADNQYG